MLDYSSDNNSNNGMNDYIIENDDTTNANNKNEGDNTSKNHNDNNRDELTFLRIRSKKKEILIAPDNEFLMVVIQNPNAGIPLWWTRVKWEEIMINDNSGAVK